MLQRYDLESVYSQLLLISSQVLNAQEKRSIGIKFLKAGSWNKELGAYAARFKTRREELTFALSMRSAVTMEEMNAKYVFPCLPRGVCLTLLLHSMKTCVHCVKSP